MDLNFNNIGIEDSINDGNDIMDIETSLNNTEEIDFSSVEKFESDDKTMLDSLTDEEENLELITCGSCDKRFLTTDELKSHFSEHYISEGYFCQRCNVKVEEFSSYYEHCMRHILDLYCVDCQLSFEFREELEEHRRNTHLEKCYLCDREFSDNQLYLEHLDADHSVESFECDICNRYYKNQYLLTRHIYSCHRDGVLKCEFCDTEFSQRRSLLRHLRLHFQEKPFACNLCDKTFRARDSLKEHLQKHSGIYSHICPLCNKGYPRKRYLVLHMKSHLINQTDGTFCCTKCEKKFDLQSKLNVHMKCHSDERPYKCDVCDKGFKFSSHLKRHKKSHNCTTYRCLLCKTSFETSQDLETHTKTDHEPSSELSISCISCGERFKHLHNYLDHTMKHIADARVCIMCNKPYTKLSSLRKHIEQHFFNCWPRPCPVCMVVIESQDSYKTHSKTHAKGRSLKCEVCTKIFKYKSGLQLHLRTHTGEKPFACEVCFKAFRFQHDKERHRRKMHDPEEYVSEPIEGGVEQIIAAGGIVQKLPPLRPNLCTLVRLEPAGDTKQSSHTDNIDQRAHVDSLMLKTCIDDMKQDSHTDSVKQTAHTDSVIQNACTDDIKQDLYFVNLKQIAHADSIMQACTEDMKQDPQTDSANQTVYVNSIKQTAHVDNVKQTAHVDSVMRETGIDDIKQDSVENVVEKCSFVRLMPLTTPMATQTRE